MEESTDSCTSVTGHSTQAGLIVHQKRLVAPEVSGCSQTSAVPPYVESGEEFAALTDPLARKTVRR